MIDTCDWLWECLYILKNMHDHDPDSPVLKWYRDSSLDGEDVYDIALNSIGEVFADTHNYWNEYDDIDVYVCFDPVINECWSTCAEYEKRTGIAPDKNKYRQELMRELGNALYISDYSYADIVYSDLDRGCPRIVLLMTVDFGLHYMVPEALCDAYSAFQYYTKLLKKALAEVRDGKEL